MPAPSSLDLQERIVAFVAAGGSRRGAPRHFSIGPSCVIKPMQRKSSKEAAAPAAMGEKKPYAFAEHAEVGRAFVAARARHRTATNMTRRHGRTRLGQRLVASALHDDWKTRTFRSRARTRGSPEFTAANPTLPRSVG